MNNTDEFLDELMNINLSIKPSNQLNTFKPDFYTKFTSKLDVDGFDDMTHFISTIKQSSLIIDVHIYDELMNIYFNHFDFKTNNNISFLTALLLCKMIHVEYAYKFNRESPSISRHRNLINIYLNIYSNIINPSSLSNILSTEIVPLSNQILSLIQTNPEQILAQLTSTCNDKIYDYFSEFVFENDLYEDVDFIKKLPTFEYDPEEFQREILGEFGIANDESDKIHPKLLAANLLLIILVKAIDEGKPDRYIKFLIYIYLTKFRTQSFNDGICFILSSIFVKNALIRIKQTNIENVVDFRNCYISQFEPVTKMCPSILINEYPDKDDFLLKLDHDRLLTANSFYQILFNEYDSNNRKFNEIKDKYDATLYFLKREHAFNKFIIEQFSNTSLDRIEEKYDDVCDFMLKHVYMLPFKLDDELFKQFYELMSDNFKNNNNYFDNMNNYNIYEADYQSICYRMIMEYFGTKERCGIYMYDAIASMNKFLSNYIIVFYGGSRLKYSRYPDYDVESEMKSANESNQSNDTEDTEPDNRVYRKYRNYFTLTHKMLKIMIDTEFVNALQYCVDNIEAYPIILMKTCADMIASFLAECFLSINNLSNYAIITRIYGSDDSHAIARIVHNREEIIFDPNLRGITKLPDFSFNYIFDDALDKYKIAHKELREIDKNVEIFDLDYPKLVKFLGGNKDELIKLFFWILVIFVVVIIVVVICISISKNKCKCKCYDMINNV